MSRRPLLLVGSKRSGTTLLVNVLNLHPRILVTHEADLVWILDCFRRGEKGAIPPYPWDDEKGLRATLDLCAPVFADLRQGESTFEELREAFFRFFDFVNTHGRGDWDHPTGKTNLAWVGDKKPVQQADPELRCFLRELLPGARFIQPLRDPRFVAASMLEAARKWGAESVPPHWRGSAEEILETWAEHQERVLAIGREFPGKLCTVQLEKLAKDPIATSRRMFQFLDLDLPEGTEEVLGQWVWKDPNGRHQPVPLLRGSKAERLALKLGYP